MSQGVTHFFAILALSTLVLMFFCFLPIFHLSSKWLCLSTVASYKVYSMISEFKIFITKIWQLCDRMQTK